MKMFNITVLLFSMFCLSASAFAGHHAATKGYALANNGETLIVMSNLSKVSDMKTYSLSNSLSALAYRPVTGDLLGFSNGAIYSVDVNTGKLTELGATFIDDAGISEGAMVGFDFNNKIDAVRAVSSSGDNLVYFPIGFGDNDPKANTVRRFTGLAYAEDDAHAGQKPMIFANAYTNAINGKKASSTFQYALDAETDSLVSLANNAGTLKTIGKVTIKGQPADISMMGGFDIVSKAEGKDKAYAILKLENQDKAGLYKINLKSAKATLVAPLNRGDISSFAASRAH